MPGKGARVELRHLAGFVGVATHLHFGRAAAQLHIAQPALSQQVAALEKELGVTLFQRSTRSVSLTQAGEQLLPVALRILDDVETAKLVVQAPDGVVGRVSLGFAGASAHNVVPQVTRAVRAAYPGIRLSLLGQMYSGEVIHRVDSRKMDLGLVRLPVKHSQIETFVVQLESLIAALPSDHPLAEKDSIDVADLADSPFVTFPGTGGSSVRDALIRVTHEAGFTPRIVQEAPDSLTILDLVAAGVGVTITVSSVLHLRRSGVVCKPLRGALPRIESALAWRRDNESPALRAVIEVARATISTPLDADR